MLSTLILVAAVLAPQGTAGFGSINEFNYADVDGRDHQFIELANSSDRPSVLWGLTLRIDDFRGNETRLVFPYPYVLAPGAYLVIGNAGVPNVDVVAPPGFLPADQGQISFLDLRGTVFESVTYGTHRGLHGNARIEGEGIWGDAALDQSGGAMCWGRVADNYSTGDNGDDFRLQAATPGASNNQPVLVSFQETFDAAGVGDTATGWVGSSVHPRVIDPTVADGNNPAAIPASPQGGQAMIGWDPSGVGNVAAHESAPSGFSRFEAYVYFDPSFVGVGQHDSWSIGFGSNSGADVTPDPLGTFGVATSGITGVAWTCQRTETSVDLVLVDYNNGGFGAAPRSRPVVLGRIAITPGVSDGWQRLFLAIERGHITARFGGTYGQADGTVFTGTTSDKARGLHIGYRAEGVPSFAARPLTLDALAVEQCNLPDSRIFGTATSTSWSITPRIEQRSEARLGGVLQIDISRMLRDRSAIVLYGAELAQPLDLSAIANPGARLWVAPVGEMSVATDGLGNATISLPIPSDRRLCGAVVAWQAVQLDPGLISGWLGLNHTEGLVTTVGY